MDRGLQHCTWGSDEKQPKEREMQEDKVIVWGGLTNNWEEKNKKKKKKGEKERYTHLNAAFQRIARRGKKKVLSEQCNDREENNKMRKIRDLFKKTWDTKWTFHAKMGTLETAST